VQVFISTTGKVATGAAALIYIWHCTILVSHNICPSVHRHHRLGRHWGSSALICIWYRAILVRTIFVQVYIATTGKAATGAAAR